MNTLSCFSWVINISPFKKMTLHHLPPSKTWHDFPHWHQPNQRTWRKKGDRTHWSLVGHQFLCSVGIQVAMLQGLCCFDIHVMEGRKETTKKNRLNKVGLMLRCWGKQSWGVDFGSEFGCWCCLFDNMFFGLFDNFSVVAGYRNSKQKLSCTKKGNVIWR